MSTLVIDQSRLVLNTFNTNATQATSSAQTSSGTDDTLFSSLSASSPSGAAAVDISKGAQLFSKLASLENTDPDKLKAALGKAASELKTAANKSTDPNEKKFLTDLSTKFEAVAEGKADLSTLQPSKLASSGASAAYTQNDPGSQGALAQTAGAHAKHHHHHGGGGQSAVKSIFDELAQAVSTSSTDTTTPTVNSYPATSTTTASASA